MADRSVLGAVGFMRTFHLPGLHQVLNDQRQGSSRVVISLPLDIGQISQGVVGLVFKPPLDVPTSKSIFWVFRFSKLENITYTTRITAVDQHYWS